MAIEEPGIILIGTYFQEDEESQYLLSSKADFLLL